MGLFSKDQDRRQYPRYNKNISVHINKKPHKVSGKANKKDAADLPKANMGKDISRGGLCFYSDVSYQPDTVLKMTIRISGLKDESGYSPMYLMAASIPVQAEARVAWCRPASHGIGYEVGVEFTSIYGDDYKILQKNLAD